MVSLETSVIFLCFISADDITKLFDISQSPMTYDKIFKDLSSSSLPNLKWCHYQGQLYFIGIGASDSGVTFCQMSPWYEPSPMVSITFTKQCENWARKARKGPLTDPKKKKMALRFF